MSKGGERRAEREKQRRKALLFYGSCHMDEGAVRPWERSLTFNNRASTGPPGSFSPERQTPQGAIRAWIEAWQPCAAPQGIHKCWHIDSPGLCSALSAWVWNREGLEGCDSSFLCIHSTGWTWDITNNMIVLLSETTSYCVRENTVTQKARKLVCSHLYKT
jgi:hypothetical protein